jgi:predicted dehydrogenase
MKTVAIVGVGLIGKERLKAVGVLKNHGRDITVTGLLDPAAKDIDSMAITHGATTYSSIEDLIAAKPDLVVVAIPHDVAVETACKLLRANLNVLLEKPVGRSIDEARTIINSCTRPDQLWIGHNYRFFPGISLLAQDIRSGHFGKPIGLSLVLGHGGSPQDRHSWKLDKIKAGGGSLIDPGIHLLDLCQFFGDKLEPIGGLTWSGFWQTGIEEECRFLLRGSNTPMVDITVSVARWRSTFRVEYFGEDGYGLVQGRGRSYGPQEYRRGRRWGWQAGKPQVESEESVITSDCENSFADEMQSILYPDLSSNLSKPCSSSEGLANMQLLENLRLAVRLG